MWEKDIFSKVQVGDLVKQNNTRVSFQERFKCVVIY